jgi:chemotaxis protein methyltransferase CheR
LSPLGLAPYKALIKERCGLLFEESGQEKLADALRARGAALGIAAAAYYPRLVTDDTEFQALVNLLTINETYFFREPEQIRLLVERLAPRFLAAQDANNDTAPAPVRILSAGCSSGEEPYSLVMALMEKYGPSVARLFTFAGGDINSAVLAKARAARYTNFSFRGVPAAIRQRYFERDRWGNQLRDEVRKLVGFHELNLLATEFPAALQDFDIVFFRNVSIYFDTPKRKLIQQNLARLMKNDGILVIGTAETLANDLGVLPLVEEDGLYYFVKGKPPLPEQAVRIDNPPLGLPAAPAAIARTPAPAPPPLLVPPGDWNLPVAAVPPAPTFGKPPADLAQARQAVRDKRYALALPMLDAVLATEPGNAQVLVLKAHVLLERKEFAAAAALARQVLADDEWSLDAFVLLGLAAKWRDCGEEAIRWFKQAVYARQECWPAHYFLADLLRASGAVEPARRAYRVIIQLLSGTAPDTGIRYLPLDLPVGEMRFLCERQLAKLPAGKTLAEPA